MDTSAVAAGLHFHDTGGLLGRFCDLTRLSMRSLSIRVLAGPIPSPSTIMEKEWGLLECQGKSPCKNSPLKQNLCLVRGFGEV